MVVEGASLELVFPQSVIKACFELVADAQFEVKGFYLEDPEEIVTIQGLCKGSQISFVFRDHVLSKHLNTSVQCQITPDWALLPLYGSTDECVGDTKNGSVTKLRKQHVKQASVPFKEPSINQRLDDNSESHVISGTSVVKTEHQEQDKGDHSDTANGQNSDPHDSKKVANQLRSNISSCSDSNKLSSALVYDQKSNLTDVCAEEHLISELDRSVLMNTLQCNLCQESSLSVEDLKAHLGKVHHVAWAAYCRLNLVMLTKLIEQSSDDELIAAEAIKAHSQWEMLSHSNSRILRRQKKHSVVSAVTKYSCLYCEEVFGHQKSLNLHIREVHHKGNENDNDSSKEMEHAVAKLSSSNKAELYKEISERSAHIAHADGLLSSVDNCTMCLICDKPFVGTRWSVRTRLPRHIETQHQVSLEKYKELLDADSQHTRMCMAQEITATQWNRKKEKKSQLLGDRTQFQCTGCGRQYCAFNNLMKHIRLAHENDDNFKEIILGAEEQGSAAYRPGMKAREQLEMTCTYCGVKRIGSCILKHLKNIHQDEETFQEELKKAADEHMTRISQREKERKKKGPQIIHDDRLFECQYCGKQFKHRQARYRHSRFKCQENTDRCKKLWCRCGKGFLTQETLMKHKVKCDKRERKFMCHLCGKVYGTSSGLYIHKQTAHCDAVGGKYKQACDICGKVFYRKQHYDRHIPKHSDERSCQCEMCGKRFKTREDIRKHQYAVHFHKYTYYCNLCGHGMNKLSYLKSHKCGRVRRQRDSVAVKQQTPGKEENLPNVSISDQQTAIPEDDGKSSQIQILSLTQSEAAVHQAVPAIFQCNTSAPSESTCVLENSLNLAQTSANTLHTVTSVTYENSGNIREMVSSQQDMELTIQNMVIHQVQEIQNESNNNMDTSNLLEMASYEGLQMLPTNTDYSLLQGSNTSVVIQPSSTIQSETVSLTALSPAVTQAVSSSYAVQPNYHIVDSSYP